MSFSLVIDDSSLRAELAAFAVRGPAAADAATFRRAQRFLDIAEPLVPRRSGRLWGSRYASRTKPVEAGFSASYAAAVEEMHQVHPSGQWKYALTALAKLQDEGDAALERDFAAALAVGETLATATARHPTVGSGAVAGVGARIRPTARRGR